MDDATTTKETTMGRRTTVTDRYEPAPQALVVRDTDKALDAQLTGKPAVEKLALALKEASFEFDADDLITIATAEDLKVEDADAYARGYELLGELAGIETRVTAHYNRFDKPLNFLIGIVRGLKS